MRFLLLLCAAGVSGCYCSPSEPQPVTLRVVNGTRAPIYVDFTRSSLGLTVQREVAGALFPFDDLACECRSCELACNASCECPEEGSPMVRRLEAGQSAQRTWDGVVRLAGYSSCGDGTCLDPVNAPLNEPFTLELCFSVQEPAGVGFDDDGVGEGALPMVSRTCTTKQFTPQDLTVEIGPVRGSSCTTSNECPGQGEYCFDGACTTGCPANDFPVLGSSWLLTVASPDNMGFFEQSARTRGRQFQGTGTLQSAVYQSGSLMLNFSRFDAALGETLTGGVQLKLPEGVGVPVATGGQVVATVVDDGPSSTVRALLLRDADTNEVLFAADMAQGGRRLLTADDLAPLQVANGTTPLGCTQDACGRLLQYATVLKTAAGEVEVEPGETRFVGPAGSQWSLLNIGNGRYENPSSLCSVTELRPYVVWKSSNP